MPEFVASIVHDVPAEHAEGPLWDPRSRTLLWVDQFVGLIHQATFDREAFRLAVTRTFEVGAPVGAVVPRDGDGGGWMLAAGNGFRSLGEDGAVAIVAEVLSGDEPVLRMNDGKCDPNGTFWAGSMAWAKTAGAGFLYQLSPEGVTTRLSDLTISNGLAWAADGGTMYFIDTPTQEVRSFRFDDAGFPEYERTVVAIPAEHGFPDGMTIDDDGCIWVALWGGHAVHRYSPDGELLATVAVDAPQVSSCTFGGPDRSTLFITTSREGYGPAEVSAHPHAGKIFAVDVGVTGPAAAGYRSSGAERR
jgi:sugar lactone lactonase YvrE